MHFITWFHTELVSHSPQVLLSLVTAPGGSVVAVVTFVLTIKRAVTSEARAFLALRAI